MKIGIIIHSFTGNTLSVAEKIRENLIKTGHSVDIERIKITGGENPNNMQFEIEDPPKTEKYDALIFGAPVRGFSISPVIAAYLKQISSLKDKKVACFVTKHLSSDWTGGHRAIASMRDFCVSKGGVVTGTGIIHWKRKDRESEIAALAETFCGMF